MLILCSFHATNIFTFDAYSFHNLHSVAVVVRIHVVIVIILTPSKPSAHYVQHG